MCENTVLAMRQILDSMQEEGPMFLREMNRDERRAYQELFNLCESFLTASEELQEENEVWQAYDGSCPDCGEDIPTDVVEGQECANCGHSFHAVREDDDGQPDEAQEWESFDPDC
jgi:hypothetical protein